MSVPDKIEDSRELITEFLRGEIDLERRREMVEDDVLLFAVVRVENADPDWILGQLANRAWPVDLRAQILRLTRSLYAEGHAIMSREAPEALRRWGML